MESTKVFHFTISKNQLKTLKMIKKVMFFTENDSFSDKNRVKSLKSKYSLSVSFL